MKTNIAKPRNRKPYRVVRVHDPEKPYHGVSADFVVEVHPNGLVVIREKGRRVRRSTTVTAIYFGCIMRELAQRPRRKRRGR